MSQDGTLGRPTQTRDVARKPNGLGVLADGPHSLPLSHLPGDTENLAQVLRGSGHGEVATRHGGAGGTEFQRQGFSCPTQTKRKILPGKAAASFQESVTGLEAGGGEGLVRRKGLCSAAWTVEGIRFPPPGPLRFYYGKIQIPSLGFYESQFNTLYVTFVFSSYPERSVVSCYFHYNLHI